MAPPVNLPLSHLRLPPLPCRRLRAIVASSSFSSHHNPTSKPRTLHARDIRIEIGRYKGRMLGTLPSSYLKWLSKSVDPNPSLSYWSELAKLVLQDPVYQDRVEWEPALRLFTGEGLRGSFFGNESFDVMKAYREIGERFGWDMEDKEAWSKINREFIGTSFSGRIPRKKGDRGELGVSESVKRGESEKKGGSLVGGKRGERIERMRLKKEKVPMRIEKKGEVKVTGELGYSDNGNGVDNGKKVGFLVGKKRGERMERMRMRREKNLQMVKSEKVVDEEILKEKKDETPRIRIKKERVSRRKGGDLGRRNRELGFGINDEMISFAKREEKSGNVEMFNPFPGRDALFEKIRRQKD